MIIPVPRLIASPFINGNRYDFTSVGIQVNGVALLGQEITSVDYKHGLKPASIYGTSPRKLGRSRGVYEADASLEITKESYAILVAALSQDPTRGYMEMPFLVTVMYADVGQPTQQDDLVGCRIVEDSDAHKTGSEGLTVRVTLDVIKILRNGMDALASVVGAPI